MLVRAYLKFAGIMLGAATVLGVVVSFLTSLKAIQGIYVVLFIVGVACLMYASAMLVGTPKRRFEYYMKMDFNSDNAKPKNAKTYESFGIMPGLLGITAIVLGFLLEAYYRAL
ncbi:hypothetical protein [Acidaminobacter hydrogenoformans]|uniref:DUF3899 domain-containing protein n=1 Tax=Acidaminobacter hydrogenoformans DSM 2784 TaxID=1120920 RepID=A0A1G5RQ92_9FIRM|nr:hypothetical protein [Acidaminobacter hydrogenoformans]SCZ76157.1 hypothetical protein SAMN03080599_00097 [Acidaminobacter hydrogenoformans DSM 2784]